MKSTYLGFKQIFAWRISYNIYNERIDEHWNWDRSFGVTCAQLPAFRRVPVYMATKITTATYLEFLFVPEGSIVYPDPTLPGPVSVHIARWKFLQKATVFS